MNKQPLKGKALWLAAAGAAIGLAAVPAVANHAWSNYHWARSGPEVTIPVIDNTTGIWPQHTSVAVSDWNQSTVIQSPLLNGSASSSCSIVSDEINVCNSDYGNNGWLGIASISVRRGHITGGSTKVNDYYFNQPQYNSSTWRQLVMCQEIGHDYGLTHQNEDFNTDLTNSCMEYTSQPQGNEHPDAHDYEQLLDIYAHSDSGGGGGGTPCRGKKCPAGKAFGVGNSPSEWGRPVDYDGNGRPNVFVRQEDDAVILTHVTWALGQGPRNNGFRSR